MTSAVPRKGVYGGVYGGRGRGGYGGYREKSEANAETKAETQPNADSQPEAGDVADADGDADSYNRRPRPDVGYRAGYEVGGDYGGYGRRGAWGWGR